MNERKWAFFRATPGSVVAYDQANNYLSAMFVDLTVPQINELQAMIAKGWAGKPV